MKLNKIAVAGMMLVAGSSFAATATLPCDKSTPVSFVNTCAPAATFFVAGSSALGGAISTVITASSTSGAKGYFDTTTAGGVSFVVSVVDTGTANGIAVGNLTNHGNAGNGVSAWYGMSRADLTGGKSVPILVVYNKYMGSAAGVSNVLANPKSLAAGVPEADIVRVGPTGNTPNTCKLVDTVLPVLGSTATVATATNKVACSSHAVTQADLAISDVNVNELLSMYDVLKGGTALSKATMVPLAMQGFAVAVNNNFYNALQAYQISTGALPSTCSSGSYTEACQPSISRAQYASLVTTQGSIKSAAGFIPGDTSVLTLARRDQLSGTQATSNIYFASEVCNALDAKSKVNTHGGALTAMLAKDATTYAPGLVVHENVQTGDVETDLQATTGYSIGLIALSNGDSGKYKFVKIDGVSPNLAGATLLSKGALRNKMIDGSWGLQMTAYAVYRTADGTYGPKALKANMIQQMVADLSDSTLHDLAAIGYFNGSVDKKTKVSRVGGNNCSPLITRTN